MSDKLCVHCGMLIDLTPHNWSDCIDELNSRIKHKDRFIAALQQTIDDLHLANSVLRADLELLKSSYWKARAIMRFENPGDETPAALTYLSLSELMISDASVIEFALKSQPPR